MTPTLLPLLGQDPDAGTEARAISADTASSVAAVLKALADPLRLRMLSFIAASPGQQACVCHLTTLTDLSQPTVSHHLKVLREVGVLTAERRGTWVWYSVAPAHREAVRILLTELLPVCCPSSTDLPPEGTTHD
ncbi:MAG: metalloregulator ArsR/SmtB family transcription factor [Micrococcales bacterium]|nr:metalloregulator ArsR/SmtB family transcription factor [Micrococcales bacterium]